MDYNDIAKLGEEYDSLQRKTDQRRKAWNDYIKKRLIESLQRIIAESRLQQVSITDTKEPKNWESVVLRLPNEASGISLLGSEGKGGQNFIKRGAALSFAQTSRGCIDVSMQVGYIEEIEEKTQFEHLDLLDPDQVIQTKVFEIVIIFMEKVNEHESSPGHSHFHERTPIGFKIGE